MSRELFKPTRQQSDIIDCTGSAFIQACPGAGKTRVMVARARQLFESMAPGRGVAFLSFTQAAVFELDTRLRQEGILASPVFPSFVGTFDAFVWKFLVAPFGIKGVGIRPRLIADLSQLQVIPFSGAQPLPLSCFNHLTDKIDSSAAKLEGFDTSQRADTQVLLYQAAAKNIRMTLHTRGHLGFDDARRAALVRLNEPELAGRISTALSRRFQEVIVDEAQDCNPEDLTIISWLRDSGVPVKVVCDPHQSIYEFRGGVTDHLLTFADKFAPNERKVMTGNFRSGPNICKAIAQLRAPTTRGAADDALGDLKQDTTPVYVLSYGGTTVPSTIGATFLELLKRSSIDASEAPVIAATKATGAAAVGQPRPTGRQDRAVRLAEAITSFHFASGFNDVKLALESVHELLLELEGRLAGTSYHQYIADNDVESASWRPTALNVVRELRFDLAKHVDAKGWHGAAKAHLSTRLTIGNGQSMSQLLKWNDAVAAALAAAPSRTAMPRTIHSVKGMEFPAVCLVTTASTLKSILEFLETGSPANKAEDARKLYVAASRAQRLLVVAAPKSQSARLSTHLRGQGASVTMSDICTS